MKIEKHQETWTGKILNQEFLDCIFNELKVRNADIKNVDFIKVHFKNSYLGFNTKYTDCTFDSCKFFGKYNSLGRPAYFKNCKFINCNFIGIDLFEGQYFEECFISGKIKNAILKDEHPEIKNTQTVFNKCNLTDTIFDNVSIYGKSIFRNTLLPIKGLRFFKNTDDSLIRRAQEICSQIDNDSKIESEIIFKTSFKKGQDPIILDELFLYSFFKTGDSKMIFEEIVTGYEL